MYKTTAKAVTVQDAAEAAMGSKTRTLLTDWDFSRMVEQAEDRTVLALLEKERKRLATVSKKKNKKRLRRRKAHLIPFKKRRSDATPSPASPPPLPSSPPTSTPGVPPPPPSPPAYDVQDSDFPVIDRLPCANQVEEALMVEQESNQDESSRVCALIESDLLEASIAERAEELRDEEIKLMDDDTLFNTTLKMISVLSARVRVQQGYSSEDYNVPPQELKVEGLRVRAFPSDICDASWFLECVLKVYPDQGNRQPLVDQMMRTLKSFREVNITVPYSELASGRAHMHQLGQN